MKNLSDCRVLIVDDAKSNLDLLVEGLKSDYKLSVALNGEMALKAVAHQQQRRRQVGSLPNRHVCAVRQPSAADGEPDAVQPGRLGSADVLLTYAQATGVQRLLGPLSEDHRAGLLGRFATLRRVRGPLPRRARRGDRREVQGH